MSAFTPMKKANRKGSKTKGVNVRVAVRCRPQSTQELKTNDSNVIACNTERCEINVSDKRSSDKTYTYDNVFGPHSTQEEVYDTVVKPIVNEVLQGFNCTVFAYGQTGTGKTHTMEGPGLTASDPRGKHAGMIPRSVKAIFDYLNANNLDNSVKISFMELYNEELSDLMSEEDKVLRLFEDSTGGGVVVHNLDETHVNNEDEVFGLLETCMKRRKTAATNMNHRSSRSHSIFTITIHSKVSNEVGEECIKTGKLHLVDLAGSECIGRSGAVDKRAKEAGNINKSLLTLGRVINILVKSPGEHIPYRDSKLTRLLKESLGGKSKTCVIATISPCANSLEETLSTLKYADQAKNIKNKPEINQKMTHKAYMKELLQQIATLKKETEVLRQKNGIYMVPEVYEATMDELKSLRLMQESVEATLAAKEKELEEITALFEKTSHDLEVTTEQKVQVEGKLQETEVVLESTKQDLHVTKVDLGETKYLVKEHVKTEKTILKQSHALQKTVEKVISEKNALHDKVDRKQKVEDNNTQTVSSFQQDITKQINAMQNVVNAFIAQQSKAYQQMHANMNQFVKEKSSEFESLQGELKNFTHSMYSTREAFQGMTEEYRGLREGFTEEQKKSQEGFSSDIHTHFQSSSEQVQTAVDTLNSTLQLQKSTLSTYRDTVSDRLAQNLKQMNEFAQQQQNVSQALHKSLTEVVERQCERVEQQKDQLSEFVSSQKKASQKQVKDLMKDVQSLFTEFMNKRMNEVSECVEEIQNNMDGQVTALTTESTQVLDSLTTSHANIDSWALKQDQQAAVFQMTASEAFNTVEAAIGQTEEQTASMHSTVQQVSGDYVSKVDAYVAQAAAGMEVDSVATEEFVRNHQFASDDMNKCVETYETTHSASLTGSVKSIQSFGADHVRVSSANADHVTSTCDKMTASYKALGSSVDTLVNDAFEKDVPTGTTPAKRAFVYPKNITGTAEHSVLLSKFREAGLNDVDELDTQEQHVEQEEEEGEEEEEDVAVVVEEDVSVAETETEVEEPAVVEEEEVEEAVEVVQQEEEQEEQEQEEQEQEEEQEEEEEEEEESQVSVDDITVDVVSEDVAGEEVGIAEDITVEAATVKAPSRSSSRQSSRSSSSSSSRRSSGASEKEAENVAENVLEQGGPSSSAVNIFDKTPAKRSSGKSSRIPGLGAKKGKSGIPSRRPTRSRTSDPESVAPTTRTRRSTRSVR